MKNDVAEKLSQIFRFILQLPDDADTSNVRRINEIRWDSLAEIAAVDSVGYELLTRDFCAFVNRRLKFHFDDSADANTENPDVSSLVVTVSEGGSVD